jgi:hypothetical protein
MIKVLSQEELALRWVEIKPYIDKAVEHGVGETSSMDMFKGAMNNTYHCVEVINNNKTVAFAMLRVNHFEDHSQLQIVTTTASSEDEWETYAKESLQYAEDTARQIGCKYVTIWGRPGWSKKLKSFGYNHTYTVMTKEV